MKLIDTDAPDHEEQPPIRSTSSRPEKRRAAVSLLFTLAVLSGTVMAIFRIFPARHRQIVTDTVAQHHRPGPWEITAPDPTALRMWTLGVLGSEPPLPDATAVGARTLIILNRRSALIRYRVAEGEITYLVQLSRDLLKRTVHRVGQSEAVDAWYDGPWSFVVVGPPATAAAWRKRFLPAN